MKALQVSINGEVIGVFVPPEGPFCCNGGNYFQALHAGAYHVRY